MGEKKTEVIEKTLGESGIHKKWTNTYRTVENETFFERAFDYIVRIINAPKDIVILDAGCGTCAHSIRLAKRGFIVQAVDLSESVLKDAEKNVKANRLENKINIRRENICSLSFEKETFSYILCWGVLMHIPNLEEAISELSRVLKPGGILIIGENNMYSLPAIISRILKRFLRKERGTVETNRTPAGIEYYRRISDGIIMTRVINIQWLVKKFRSEGFIIKKHIARQFTELYTSVSSPLLKSLIHSFNNFWFEYIKIPHLSLGNLLILQKKR